MKLLTSFTFLGYKSHLMSTSQQALSLVLVSTVEPQAISGELLVSLTTWTVNHMDQVTCTVGVNHMDQVTCTVGVNVKA